MKKRRIALVILSFLLMAGCSNKNLLSNKLIAEIDKNCGDSSSCQISLKEITDFKWDTCVIYDYGSECSEISEALGVDFDGMTDGHCGIVFAYDNKIVYVETITYDPDHPKNFRYYIEKPLGGPTCVGYTYDNAVLEGTKKKIDERYYYSLTAVMG